LFEDKLEKAPRAKTGWLEAADARELLWRGITAKLNDFAYFQLLTRTHPIAKQERADEIMT
jgi:hypothetical protein